MANIKKRPSLLQDDVYRVCIKQHTNCTKILLHFHTTKNILARFDHFRLPLLLNLLRKNQYAMVQ